MSTAADVPPAAVPVVVSFTSANRDAAVFADPDRFDVRRTSGLELNGPPALLRWTAT